MDSTKLRFGIPDVDLQWSCGGTVNPSCFAGHQLVVLFLPTEPQQQAAEFESYAELAGDLPASDAWILLVGDEPHAQRDSKMPVALDSDDQAWRAFREAAGDVKLDRAAGAAFFFTRGGALHRVWPGRGHRDAVAGELQSRS